MEVQRIRGGARSVAAVEVWSEQVRRFNATARSGFIMPDIGDGYFDFHQSSLISDGRNSYCGLNIGSSIKFDSRADYDGRPRALDVVAPGCSAFTGDFHSNGSSGSGARNSRDNDLSVGVACGYHGCNGEKDRDAIPVLLDRLAMCSAHQVFDDMPRQQVVWDDVSQDCELRCGLFEKLARYGDCFVDEQKWARKLSFIEETPNDSMSHSLEFGCDSSDEMFSEMPLADVIWDEDLLQGFDSSCDGLLQQLADGGMPMKEYSATHSMQNVIKALSLSSDDAHGARQELPRADVIWDDDLHEDYEGASLEQLVQHGQYLVGDDMEPLTVLDCSDRSTYEEQYEFEDQVVSNAYTCEVIEKISCQVQWDNNLTRDHDTQYLDDGGKKTTVGLSEFSENSPFMNVESASFSYVARSIFFQHIVKNIMVYILFMMLLVTAVFS